MRAELPGGGGWPLCNLRRGCRRRLGRLFVVAAKIAQDEGIAESGFAKSDENKTLLTQIAEVAKKLDAKKPITEDVLVEAGVVRRKLDGVRVLAKGEISAKIDLSVTGASKAAVEAVEKAGGSLSVTTATAAE